MYATSFSLARLSVPVGWQTLGILDSNFSSVSEQTHFVKPLSVSPFLVNKKLSLDRSIHIPIADSQAPRQMGVFCDTRFPHGLLCNITVNKTAKCWNGLMEGFFLGQIPKYTTFCAAGHGKQSVPSAAGMGGSYVESRKTAACESLESRGCPWWRRAVQGMLGKGLTAWVTCCRLHLTKCLQKYLRWLMEA